MVEDAITDGKRIAELLASELSGLAVGPLDRVDVVEADPGVEAAESGTYAYAIEYGFDGERIGEVHVRPASAVLTLDDGWGDTPRDHGGVHLDGADLVIERGAAVKRAVDALRVRLERG